MKWDNSIASVRLNNCLEEWEERAASALLIGTAVVQLSPGQGWAERKGRELLVLFSELPTPQLQHRDAGHPHIRLEVGKPGNNAVSHGKTSLHPCILLRSLS